MQLLSQSVLASIFELIRRCAQFQGKISLFPLRKRHYTAENVMDLLVKQAAL